MCTYYGYMVILQVIDDITDSVLGTVTLPLVELTKHSHVQAKPYQLTTRAANTTSFLTISLSLKVYYYLITNIQFY